jgi:quercetin dioxygenase-like cupin family protein
MSKTGDIFENPVTGEHGYIRIGTDETNGDYMVADLRVRPGGAVMGEHIHENMDEKFTVLSGSIGYKLGDTEGVANAGDSFFVPKNKFHDWWNAGDDEAHVIVEFKPARRFEQMITTFFGLAVEGKTNEAGLPNLLQLAVISDEFGDVLRLKNPPVWIQNILFGVLARIGRLLGYRATYAHHQLPAETVEVEPLPAGLKMPSF